MSNKIEQDHRRFRQIVKGRIRADLKRFIARGDFLARDGKKIVSVPVHDIDLPRFRYGDNSGGVGMGEGEGDKGEGQGQGGRTTGGDEPGQHVHEVDVSLEELADILGEELELPNIEPRGEHRLTTIKDKYTGIRQTGPSALRHFKRSYREAIKRQLMLGDYDFADPIVVPIKRDMRYRSWDEVKSPQSNAVIVSMMDVSGSMGGEQKELVRLEAFWIDTWLRRNYDGVKSRYIVHDVGAREVDRETFFSLREDGGTRISSAYQLCLDLLEEKFDPSAWNIYLFHFSDGDNSSDADNRQCVKLLREKLLPMCNLFGYCQVASAYGSGNFINVLHDSFPDRDSRGDAVESALITSRINGRDDIMGSLRTLFKPGR